LIKIVSEFHYVLIESLACVRIFLVIFRLEIEIVVEDILKIYYIEIPINNNILAVIYLFLAFSYIGRDPVKIYFGIINFDIFSSIVAAMIIKSVIILPFIDSKIL
jgi:hypothetical protein